MLTESVEPLNEIMFYPTNMPEGGASSFQTIMATPIQNASRYINITNSTRVGYKNVLFGMNYRINIGCGESGTKEAGFRHRTCGPMSENCDSDLATMCQSGSTTYGPAHFT